MSYLRAYNASYPSLWTSDDGPDWFKPLYDPAMPANSIIKADLEYVSHYWNASGFDLWEEVEGLHFFTAMVQLRALNEGAALASAFADNGAAEWYAHQASLLSAFLPKFWSRSKSHLIETLSSPRSGLDCGLLLGSLHGSPATTSSNPFSPNPPYPPYSDELLLSLLALVHDQRARFPINSAPTPGTHASHPLAGVGLGRYPEDVYDGDGTNGGNPWFLCTSSAAEVLYRVATYLRTTSTLSITELGLPFWSALLTNTPSSSYLKPGTYGPKAQVFRDAVKKLKSTGDGFLEVVMTHADSEGALSEQFDRVTGFERGARDLTWSYGAFLQAVRARGRV
jgi:glucoamylase